MVCAIHSEHCSTGGKGSCQRVIGLAVVVLVTIAPAGGKTRKLAPPAVKGSSAWHACMVQQLILYLQCNVSFNV